MRQVCPYLAKLFTASKAAVHDACDISEISKAVADRMTSGLDATPQPAGLHPDMAAHLYRLSMLLQLPDGGVRFALPDAATCKDRFVRTRWPEGVTCPECGARSIQTLPTRDIFPYRECRQQFSPTSGTALHRSRLPIQMWLLAAEAIIRWQARHHSDDGITLDVLGRLLGIHTEAASRVKRISTLRRWLLLRRRKSGRAPHA